MDPSCSAPTQPLIFNRCTKLSNMKQKKNKMESEKQRQFKEVASPFDYCDFITSTTHKSLRGPKGGIILYRRGTKPRKQGMVPNHGNDCSCDFEEKINFALYPSLQGSLHNNHVAARATALKQVKVPEYKVYMQQVKKSADALASTLLKRKCRLVTNGTENHLLPWDLTTLGLIDRNYEACEVCYITHKSFIVLFLVEE